MRTSRRVRITARRWCERRMESQTFALLRGRLGPASVMTQEAAHIASTASLGVAHSDGRRWIIVLRLRSPSEHRVLVDVFQKKRLQCRENSTSYLALRYQRRQSQNEKLRFLLLDPAWA